jgi:hypothetical protein
VTALADYYDALARVHEVVDPRVYLEVGVHQGHSFRLATAATLAVGVDPSMDLRFPPPAGSRLFDETSDQFFATHSVDVFRDAPIDVAFLDGLHHWDQTLRDFRNAERHSHPLGRIVIHDCVPIDADTSTRQRTTVVWSGDVWKVVVWLRRYRPDLRVTTLDVPPTGLAVVTGLCPTNDLMDRGVDDDELWALDFSDVSDSLAGMLDVRRGTRDALDDALSV